MESTWEGVVPLFMFVWPNSYRQGLLKSIHYFLINKPVVCKWHETCENIVSFSEVIANELLIVKAFHCHTQD